MKELALVALILVLSVLAFHIQLHGLENGFAVTWGQTPAPTDLNFHIGG